MTNEREPLWSDEQYEAYNLGMATEREHQNALSRLSMAKYEARIAELEARLAQTWQPLPINQVVQYNGEWPAMPAEYANDQLAICRLVERAESQPTYSHRNGETEPPTVNGWYWYYHEDDWYGMYHVTGDRYELGPISGVLSEEFEGQWWGPVVAPWEVDHE